MIKKPLQNILIWGVIHLAIIGFIIGIANLLALRFTGDIYRAGIELLNDHILFILGISAIMTMAQASKNAKHPYYLVFPIIDAGALAMLITLVFRVIEMITTFGTSFLDPITNWYWPSLIIVTLAIILLGYYQIFQQLKSEKAVFEGESSVFDYSPEASSVALAMQTPDLIPKNPLEYEATDNISNRSK